MNILLIEDSDPIRRTLEIGLSKEGFVVDTASNGEEGYSLAMAFDYTVIVLDLMLPGLPGEDVLNNLRNAGKETPIMLFSAKDQVADRVNGLRNGADDYLVKPYSFDELTERIRALARRSCNSRLNVIESGLMKIDLQSRRVSIGDASVLVTPTEFKILECLGMRKGKPVSKESIYQYIYGGESEKSSNVVEASISVLRKKFRGVSSDEIIHTRHGFGYSVD